MRDNTPDGVSWKTPMAEFSIKIQHWSLGLETFGDTLHVNLNNMVYSLKGPMSYRTIGSILPIS